MSQQPLEVEAQAPAILKSWIDNVIVPALVDEYRAQQQRSHNAVDSDERVAA